MDDIPKNISDRATDILRRIFDNGRNGEWVRINPDCAIIIELIRLKLIEIHPDYYETKSACCTGIGEKFLKTQSKGHQNTSNSK